MIKRGRGIVGTSLRRQHRNWMLRILGVLFLSFGVLWAAACSSEEGSYGPYHVIGYNYTDRHIFSFVVNGFGGGSSDAHEPGGGGGIVCCMEIPRRTKDLHIKVVYELTKEQYEKNLPHDTFETDIPVPPLPNKHDGYIEFHFLPKQRVEAKWVDFPTKPDIPNTTPLGG